MFNLYYLDDEYKWKFYYCSKDIDLIYRTIEIMNIAKEAEMYRIDIENRVFAFLNNSEYQLNFMRKHYNTNEKCKPRYTSDEYDLGLTNKIKKKNKRR